MESIIIKPKIEILRQYVQYFLFFNKTDNGFVNYTTFPNNNLCLAIYKENYINYIKQPKQNDCIISHGGKNFTSRFYGFHKMPFNVDINSYVDQICIIFHPAALRAFTHESYKDLMNCDNISDIFSSKDKFVLEQIFDEADLTKRADKLECLLLENLKYQVPEKLKEALYIINSFNIENLNVDSMAKKLDISTPSLFRLFKNHLGQSPKGYLKTLRFRNALNDILNNNSSLSDITYLNQFYDQAHFINDFKSFSGYSPKQLLDKVSLQQNDLAWIYNKK